MTTSLKNVDEYDIMCMQIYNNGSLDGIMEVYNIWIVCI